MEITANEMLYAQSYIRNALLERFPKEKIKDIDTGRVEKFFGDEGLKVKPYIIIEKEDLDEATKISRNLRPFDRLLEGKRPTGERSSGAGYNSELDLVVVVRDRDAEQHNGVSYTEYQLVHELGHATGLFENQHNLKPKTLTFDRRVGFALPTKRPGWGYFLEEGFVEMLAGKYISQRLSPQEWQKRGESLGWVGQLKADDTMPQAPETLSDFIPLPIPLKYHFVKPGQPNGLFSTPSYAAAGLELLCKKNPKLYQLLKDSRYSVTGLRVVAKEINALDPKLYAYLQKSEYTENDFAGKLDFIIQRFYGNVRNVIQGNEVVRDVWNGVLQRASELSAPTEKRI